MNGGREAPGVGPISRHNDRKVTPNHLSMHLGYVGKPHRGRLEPQSQKCELTVLATAPALHPHLNCIKRKIISAWNTMSNYTKKWTFESLQWKIYLYTSIVKNNATVPPTVEKRAPTPLFIYLLLYPCDRAPQLEKQLENEGQLVTTPSFHV